MEETLKKMQFQLELSAIDTTLEKMEGWLWLDDEDKEMQKELKKRKKFLEFLLENA